MSLGPERPLRVMLNLLFIGEQASGVGRYCRRLPGALLEAEPRTEVHVLVSSRAPSDLNDEPWADGVRWIRVPVRNEGLPLVGAEYLLSPAISLLRRADVIHSPANTGPVITPGVASAVSLMDVIWLVRANEWARDAKSQRSLERQVRHAVRHADQVLAISHTAAREICEQLDVEAHRVSVTLLGVDAPVSRDWPVDRVRAQLELTQERILLCVAQKLPYKNLPRLVEALPALPQDVVLVICGQPTKHEAELRRQAETLGVANRLRLPSWVPEEELEALYATATAFALPSMMEGFGLPVLEAMARGLPVACSDRSALKEVVGDAALLFDPEKQEQVTAALRRVVDDRALATELIERGRVRAARFSWRETGNATLKAYRAAVASRTTRSGSRADGRAASSA